MSEKIFLTYTNATLVPYQGSVLGYHVVINYIDSADVHHTLQGTPERPFNNNIDKAKAFILEEVFSDGTNNRDSPFGRLKGVEGRDADVSMNHPHTLIAEGNDLSARWALMQGYSDEVNSTGFEYRPVSQNSDSFAGGALQRGGYFGPGTEFPERFSNLLVFDPGSGETRPVYVPGFEKPLTNPLNGDAPFPFSLSDSGVSFQNSTVGGNTILEATRTDNQIAPDVKNAEIILGPEGQILQTQTSNNTGSSTRSVFDVDENKPWSSETSAFDAYQRLQSQRVDSDNGGQQIKEYDPNNTHPYTELDITKGTDGQITAAQLALDQNIIAAGGSVGQIFGSALGRALAPNNQFAQLAVGTVAGLIGQKLLQTFTASLTLDASRFVVGDFASVSGLDVAHAGIGAISSFLTAELGRGLGLTGFGAELFNGAVGGVTGSVLNQIVDKVAPAIRSMPRSASSTGAPRPPKPATTSPARSVPSSPMQWCRRRATKARSADNCSARSAVRLG